jgi:hypothetical protein
MSLVGSFGRYLLWLSLQAAYFVLSTSSTYMPLIGSKARVSGLPCMTVAPLQAADALLEGADFASTEQQMHFGLFMQAAMR